MMICPVCGAQVHDDLKYCSACGALLQADAPADGQMTGAAVPEAEVTPLAAAAAEIAANQEVPPVAAPGPTTADLLAENQACGCPADDATNTVAAAAEQINTSQAKPDIFAEPPAAAVNTVYAAPAAAAPIPQQEDSKPIFFDDDLAPIVGIGSWLLALLILLIIPIALLVVVGLISSFLDSPLISTILFTVAGLSGIIICLIWAFNGRANPSKKNFFRALLIVVLLILAAGIVLWLLFSDTIIDWLQTQLTAWATMLGRL